MYNALNFPSGRILKSTCPVQTVSPGPVSTHTRGISSVCLNVKMTRLKLKQECRFLWNNNTETCLSNTYPLTSLSPHLRQSSKKAFHTENIRLYNLIIGMKIRSFRSQALTRTGGDCQIIGGNDGQKQFLFKVVYSHGERKQKVKDQYCSTSRLTLDFSNIRSMRLVLFLLFMCFLLFKQTDIKTLKRKTPKTIKLNSKRTHPSNLYTIKGLHFSLRSLFLS